MIVFTVQIQNLTMGYVMNVQKAYVTDMRKGAKTDEKNTKLYKINFYGR